jgi:hypothetical protein
MKSKPVEFQIPEGYTLPEGAEPGEDFDVVCSIRVKANGTLCLVKLGDVEMPGYKDKDKDDKQRPAYGQARQMMTGESMMGGE